ncbi:hypothetical protein QYF61_003450 [Mycteria americana]|uniref:Vacuolar protein sorting-associated protein 54 N-terminal domain-containing protein n=1 Tax=Mycteria americana TaxID=33587 RepID=A0AAN7PGR0_MYCAM|nr:hypothetical protein QYF61_003450 [Mycteria americana]
MKIPAPTQQLGVVGRLGIFTGHFSLLDHFTREELRELREEPTDPQAQQEIINSIEEVYFSNDSFDIVKYELEVSKKVADLILEKQPAYVQQRTDVRLSEMLEEEDYPGAIQLCLECQKAASTFKHYSCISELNSKLQDTLEQIEGEDSSPSSPAPAWGPSHGRQSFTNFSNEQLDVALSKICKNFDISHYTKVQQAYRLLGKTQTAMDQLHMHFTQAIHNTVFQVVLGYVELCAGNTDTKFQKLQYKDLCTLKNRRSISDASAFVKKSVQSDVYYPTNHITSDSYIPCLADLCKALWEVMLSYYRTMQWHENHDQDENPQGEEKVSGSDNKMTGTVATPILATGTAAEPENQPVPVSVTPINKKKSWKDDEKGGPSREEEELIKETVTTQSLSLSELQDMQKDLSCHSGEHVVTWLLRCWDNGASSLQLQGKEAKQPGSLSRQGGIDKVIGKGAQVLSPWRQLLSGVKER